MDGSGTADRVDRVAVSLGVSTAGATHSRKVDPLTVTQRLQREGRWAEIAPVRDWMMKDAKGAFPTKEERQQWVYGELDRMYPPLDDPSNDAPLALLEPSLPPNLTSDGQIQGLSSIPEDWPELPANASLSAEIGWVQANRLRIVAERPGRATLIRLHSAMSPAPSWSALGWLETSIRSYAKFVDVSAKAGSADDGESAWMKREKMAIDEVEALINEMAEDQGRCPKCGR